MKRIAIGLVLLNLGVLFTTAAFLPRSGTYFYRNAIEKFIHERDDWDIAWSATLGSSLLSTALAVLMSKPPTRKSRSSDESEAQPFA